MTENEFLDRQESRLRKELSQAAHRIETHLSRAIPVERAVREHPVVSLGAGAVGGVAAGLVVGKLLGARSAQVVLGSLRLAARPVLRGAGKRVIDALFGADPEPEVDDEAGTAGS